MANRFFTQASFDFLAKLAGNNNREWFARHKQEYEEAVRTPALNFIADMGDALQAISPHFLAEPRKVGGSLMRVHRDVRFGRDKRPFKTNIGIQFRHRLGKDVHAPGFYLHIEPGGCFVGAGIWHPDAPTLGSLRAAIAENGSAWLKVRRDRKFAGPSNWPATRWPMPPGATPRITRCWMISSARISLPSPRSRTIGSRPPASRPMS